MHINFSFSFKGFCLQIGQRSSQTRGRASPTKEGNKSRHPRRLRCDSRRCRAAHAADPCSLGCAVRCPHLAHGARPAALMGTGTGLRLFYTARRWAASPSGVTSTGRTRTCWSESRRGTQRCSDGWSASPMETELGLLRLEQAAGKAHSSLPVPKGGL